MKPKVAYRGVGGLTVWDVPDSTLQIMWAGPGSSLLIGQPMIAGGAVTSIDHGTAAGTFDNAKDATKAVSDFFAAALSDASINP